MDMDESLDYYHQREDPYGDADYNEPRAPQQRPVSPYHEDDTGFDGDDSGSADFGPVAEDDPAHDWAPHAPVSPPGY